MKTSIMHLMGLFLVLAFTASCGKKESGGSSTPLAYLPYTSGVGTVVGSPGHTALVNWLDAADTSLGMRAYFEKKTNSMNAFVWNSNICQIVGINIPGCIKPTQCLVSNNMAVDLGTTEFDNLRPRNCVLSGTFYSKRTDTALRESVLGKSGRVVMKDRTVQNGTIYTVYYSLYEGSQQVSGAAQINTSLPAALNPVVLEENGQRTKTYFLPY